MRYDCAWRGKAYLPFFFAAGFAPDFVVFFETGFLAAAMGDLLSRGNPLSLLAENNEPRGGRPRGGRVNWRATRFRSRLFSSPFETMFITFLSRA